MSDDETLAALTERVLHPLVCGSELRLLEPIGPKRALEHARVMASVPEFSGDVENEVQWQRLRIARRYCPVDWIPPPSPAEWLLVSGLNDLLQVTNPDLPGLFAADRPLRLLELCIETIDAAGAPRTVGDALFRHATFSRVLEIVRLDTHVSWWVGSRTYRGARPPSRLLAWQRLRRVHTRQEQVAITDMADDERTWAEDWLRALARWLAASPLTDLEHALRTEPSFRWTGATLGLIASGPGRTLARRAVARAGDARRARELLESAAGAIDASQPDAARFAAEFAREICS